MTEGFQMEKMCELKSWVGGTNQPFLCVPHLFANTAIFQALVRCHW